MGAPLTLEWSSWAGAVDCRPHAIERPASEAAVAALVRRAAEEGRCVRAVGTGHSSMPLVPTDGVIVSLDDLAGVESADREALRATVRAGTKIRDLGAPLLAAGLALENQGDIDVQSIAGAVGTGTHGTGRSLGNLSSQVVGMRLVSAAGEGVELTAERDAEALRAARVSLGALGVMTALTLRVLPAYRVHERTWRVGVEECMADLERLIAENRHFEFFWYPTLDESDMKTLNPTDEAPDELPDRDGERIGWSKDIISSVRDVKHHEMEYSVPAEAGPECFWAVRARMREKHPEVRWPVEYRTVAPDDAWLSPASGRPTVTISVHQAQKREFRAFFADIETIFLEHRGRPHWGKIHTRRAEDLRALYPHWDDFRALRRRMDPDGLFLNDWLRRLFEA